MGVMILQTYHFRHGGSSTRSEDLFATRIFALLYGTFTTNVVFHWGSSIFGIGTYSSRDPRQETLRVSALRVGMTNWGSMRGWQNIFTYLFHLFKISFIFV